MENKEQICQLMDKLSLEMLQLIQEQIMCKINIEKRTNEGNLLLAKARYIQGSNSVSISQLPTANSDEFKALVNVVESENDVDNFLEKQLIVQTFPVNKTSGYIDPMKWFGVLVPRSLQFARERFQMSIELVVECANIQRKLQRVMFYLTELQKIKDSL